MIANLTEHWTLLVWLWVFPRNSCGTNSQNQIKIVRVVTVQQFAPQHLHADVNISMRYQQRKAQLLSRATDHRKFVRFNLLYCKVI
jgi:hypothetical protein